MDLRFEDLQPGEYIATRQEVGDDEGAIIAADEQYGIGILRAIEGQEYNDAWPTNMQRGYIDALPLLEQGPMPTGWDFPQAWAVKEENP